MHTDPITLDKELNLQNSLRSVRDALDVLGSKWKIPILLSLRDEPKRFNEIQRDLKGITAKTLSKELKELEMNRVISRSVAEDSPFGVTYSVTVYCKSLQKIVEGLKEWGDHHRALIFNRTGEPDKCSS
jgi:DNA-binding HxlR family transcriptional regulator